MQDWKDKVNSASAYDDTVIVFDIARGAFILRDGFQVADMATHNGKIYIVNGSRYIYEFNKGESYDGQKINAYWKTQATDLGAKYTKKQIKCIMMRSKQGIISISIRSGDSRMDVQKNLFDDNDGFVSIPVMIDQSRVFQITFENQEGSSFSINGGVDILFEKEIKAP